MHSYTVCIYIYIYILRTLTRHRRTSMFFEIWVLWGDAGLCPLCVWASRLGAAWLGFGSCGDSFWSPGLHFESFVAPWGEPGPPEAPQRQK